MTTWNLGLALAAGLLLSPVARATDTAVEQTFRAFSHCDARFFSSLQTHAAVWEKHAPLQQENGISWISVPQRNDLDNAMTPLKDPPQVGGATLLSYFNNFDDLGPLGRYLFWGFVVDGPVNEVAQRLRPFIARPEQLQAVDETQVRAEERHDGRWQAVAPQPGRIPGTRLLERVLIFEAHPDAATPQTRVSCTLQGAVDASVLEELRPDIAPAEHPQSPDFGTRASGAARRARP